MFKQNFGKNPDVFQNVFVKSISQYNTRNRSKLIPNLALAVYVSSLFRTKVPPSGANCQFFSKMKKYLLSHSAQSCEITCAQTPLVFDQIAGSLLLLTDNVRGAIEGSIIIIMQWRFFRRLPNTTTNPQQLLVTLDIGQQ